MNEEQIRSIIRDEMRKNYYAGNSQVPPHNHDGSSNTYIDTKAVKGFMTLGNDSSGVIKKNTVTAPTFLTSFSGPTIVYPVPIVFSGVAGTFNGGEAPDGTILIDSTGGATHFNVCIDNTWHSVVLS